MSRSRYEELERAAVLDPDEDEDAAEQKQSTGRKRVSRLPNLPGHFVRIPIAWLRSRRPATRGRPRRSLFDSPTRLFLFVLYKSHWGQKGVPLTSALAAEIGMSRRTKNRSLEVLERTGRVRVERKGRAAAIVWPIVLS